MHVGLQNVRNTCSKMCETYALLLDTWAKISKGKALWVIFRMHPQGWANDQIHIRTYIT